MAINYLNSIDLNRNELQNAQLIKAQVENQPNDASAGTGLEGQLYYDTTLDVLKVWAGGAWVEVGGGVETLTTTDGTYIDLTPNSATSGAVTVTADLSAADGTASAASRFLTKDNTWATVPQGDITALTEGTYIGIDNPTGPIPTINHDLTSRTDTISSDTPGIGGSFEAVASVTTNTTGHVTAIDVVTINLPASPTITLTGEVTGSGTTSISTTVANNVLDVANFNATAIVTAAEGIENNDNDTTLPTSAAVKAYADSLIVGGLIYQGGYDAATNTPNLDATPIAGIKKGWTYTVTVDGLFFTEQVRVGDVIIAEIDSPTTLADWTTVQNNVDLADLTTVGIGNVNAGTGIDVSYTSGTATVSLTAVAARSGSIAVPNSATYTYPNSINSLAGTNSVMIQLVDSNGDTVHADVKRLTPTTFSVSYGVATPTNVIALIQLIG